MNIVNNGRYPPYPMSSRTIIDPRVYPTSRTLDGPYTTRYLTERPDIISRSRSYLNCRCGLPISTQGDHLCRSCNLITHAANQVLNIRGGDHCDCPDCSLALADEERELEVMDRYGGYYSTGSDICRSCGRRNCPIDCRPTRVPLIPRRAVAYPRESALVRRDVLPLVRPPLMSSRGYTTWA